MAKVNPKKRTHADGATSWHATIELSSDPVTGKRRQKRITAPTKRAVEERALAELSAVRRGEYVPPSSQTVAEFLADWLDGPTMPARDSTVLNYAATVRCRIVPVLGRRKLSDLTTAHVQALYATMRERGYKASTIRLTHQTLSAALNRAVALGLVRRNPAADAVLPREGAKPDPPTWTADEARRFFAANAADPLLPLWRVALETGLRIGELLALRWADLDLGLATLGVRRTLTRDRHNRWHVGDTTKSKSGRRTLALSPACVAALRAHRARQAEARLAAGPAWRDGDLVFANHDGRFRQPFVVARRFRAANEAAGVTRLTLHQLRHSSATLMLAAGVHPLVVQARLGHGSISMTISYSHVNVELQRDAVAAISGLIDVVEEPSPGAAFDDSPDGVLADSELAG